MRRIIIGLSVSLFLTSCQDKEGDAGAPEAVETVASSGWETEEFSELASEVIDEWKAFLRGEEIEGLSGASSSLVGLELRESGLQGQFQVLRAGKMPSGSRALASVLEELRARFGDAGIELAEIKTVKVNLSDEGGETHHLVHLANEALQVNAEWAASWKAGEELRLEALQAGVYEEVRKTGGGSFVDSTGEILTGDVEQFERSIDHWLARIEMKFGLDASGAHGVSVADFNGDGLDDLFYPDAGGLPNRVFVQTEDGRLDDVSEESGLNYLDHTYSSLFVDLDNDGDQDAVMAMSRGVLCLENDGSGKFAVKGVELFPQAVAYSLSAADYDQDGDLDLFANCYTKRFGGAATKDVLARPVPYHDAVNGGRNELLRNDGGFRFRSVTKAAGLGVENYKFTYSSSWEDYDQDGDLDLYVANDFGRNHFFENQLVPDGKAIFEERAEAAGIQDVAAGMSTCWGDYNNDGRMDLYVGNMFSSAGNRIAFQDRFMPEVGKMKSLYQRHARGNSLFQNEGGGRFKDVPSAGGASMGRWSWSSLFTDFDNDGWEDLLIANGFVTQKDPDDL